MFQEVRRHFLAVLGLAALAPVALALPAQAANSRGHAAANSTIIVYAGSSLTSAFNTIAATFGQQHNVTVKFNYGGSDTLVNQMAQGAPADVFASANTAQMNIAVSKGLIAAGTPQVFARNRLVVIVPKSNPKHLYSLPDLGEPGVSLVLADPTVPVGKYARAALTVMANDAAFGPDFLSRVTANIKSNELDDKSVVAKVQLGEADAGIVYSTDVTSQVGSIPIPAPYNQIATYPIAVTKSSHNAAVAQAFVNYVLSSAGQSVLTQDGFITTTPAGGYSPSFTVTGLVTTPTTFTVADLQKLPAVTVKVTKRTDVKVLGTDTYTGVLLNTVIQQTVPISNTSFKNDPLNLFATVHATDNYAVTVGFAEMLPNFGNQQILLAYAEDGKPLAKSDGAVELVVPNDYLAGRDVYNVDEIVVGRPLGNW
jgi:molybdate transport system substrate-binding protein